jgi:DNA-binding MarR family transcriptional regulator
MQTNKSEEQGNKNIVRRILSLSENIFQVIKLSIPPEWLSADMTVTQLRVLLLLHTEGPSRMSSIASSLNVAVSTATGIIDNLVKKELVMRGTDPDDRRLVICSLSPQGQKTMNRLWALGQLQMKKLLQGLSSEQLKKAEELAEILLLNVKLQSSNSNLNI